MPREGSHSLSMQTIGCTPYCSIDAVAVSISSCLIRHQVFSVSFLLNLMKSCPHHLYTAYSPNLDHCGKVAIARLLSNNQTPFFLSNPACSGHLPFNEEESYYAQFFIDY